MEEKFEIVRDVSFKLFDEIIELTDCTYPKDGAIVFKDVIYHEGEYHHGYYNNGKIEIRIDVEPGTLAHELGHMFHHNLDRYCRRVYITGLREPLACTTRKSCESFAEAIRYFVGERTGEGWGVTDLVVKCDKDFQKFKNLILNDITNRHKWAE